MLTRASTVHPHGPLQHNRHHSTDHYKWDLIAIGDYPTEIDQMFALTTTPVCHTQLLLASTLDVSPENHRMGGLIGDDQRSVVDLLDYSRGSKQ
jgi:hypothetical protein